MAEYQLSNKAETDTFDIYFYSFEQFGEDQADAYLVGLKEKLLFLAERPYIGKKIDDIREGYFRYEYVSHTVFYKVTDYGIFVVRVLHKSMDAKLHL